MQRVESILSFWFGPFGADGFPLEDRNKLWFYANADTDTQIRQCFEPDLQKAGSGQLAPWQHTPRARLALIILLDQFSRNIYRGTPQAFAQDPAASALALAGIRQLRTGQTRKTVSTRRVAYRLWIGAHA